MRRFASEHAARRRWRVEQVHSEASGSGQRISTIKSILKTFFSAQNRAGSRCEGEKSTPRGGVLGRAKVLRFSTLHTGFRRFQTLWAEARGGRGNSRCAEERFLEKVTLSPQLKGSQAGLTQEGSTRTSCFGW